MIPTNQTIDKRSLALRIMRRAYREVAKKSLVDSGIHTAIIEQIYLDKSLIDGFMIYTLETEKALYKVSMDLTKFLFVVTIETQGGRVLYSNVFGF